MKGFQCIVIFWRPGTSFHCRGSVCHSKSSKRLCRADRAGAFLCAACVAASEGRPPRIATQPSASFPNPSRSLSRFLPSSSLIHSIHPSLLASPSCLSLSSENLLELFPKKFKLMNSVHQYYNSVKFLKNSEQYCGVCCLDVATASGGPFLSPSSERSSGEKDPVSLALPA